MKFYGIEMDGPMILERLDALPEFNVESDIGRYVYVSTEMGGVVYYGSQTKWERLLINADIGTAIDVIDDHVNDFDNPHQVTTTQIGATPLTTFNAHVNDSADPHNTVDLIQTQLVPPGAVFHFARNTAPSGYLICNGSIVSRSTYANLFAAIGTTFGAGNGTTTFGLPNLLGEFIRGWDAGRGIDSGRVFGSFQGEQTNNLAFVEGTDRSGPQNVPIDVPNTGAWSSWIDSGDGGGGASMRFRVRGVETRPRNIALLPCIKF